LELADRVVTVRAADSNGCTRSETTVHFCEMKRKVRQVFDHMVRIDRRSILIGEGKRVSEIRPDITLATNEIGINIDPPLEVTFLAGTQLSSRGVAGPPRKCPVNYSVRFHERTSRSVVRGLERA